MTLNSLASEIHKVAKEHGFWDKERNFGEMIALMHSELSEALEEHRSGNFVLYYNGNKPEGVSVELADCLIRILDTMYFRGVDIDTVVQLKINYNKSRPHKHGKDY